MLPSFILAATIGKQQVIISQSALAKEFELRATVILGVGSVLQAFIGLALLLAIHAFFMS